VVVYYVIGKKEAFEIMQSFVEDGALGVQGIWRDREVLMCVCVYIYIYVLCDVGAKSRLWENIFH